jgi:cytoskeletal protein CcmA (bactofilin family)
MKTTKYLIFIFLIAALLWPTTAYAKEPFEDKVIFGGVYTLESGDSLDGNLVVFGGAVTVEEQATVNGDLVLMGGTLNVDGRVNGNVVTIGGVANLGSQAFVDGDLVTMGAALDREEGAQVDGQVITGGFFPFDFEPPEVDHEELNGVHMPSVVDVNISPVLDVVWFFFRTFMWSALAVLLVIFLSEHTERIAKAAFTEPLITGAAGLLTAILAPLALIALTITLILIPVTLVAIVVLVVAWALGWIALGLEVGRRIAKLFNQEWAPAIAAGVGTFLLLFVLGGLSDLLPCVGWLPRTLVGLWGLGAVLLTRFGTQDYPVYAVGEPEASALIVEGSEVETVSVEIEPDVEPEPEPIEEADEAPTENEESETEE